MAVSVLLDTCAAIWLMAGDPLSEASRALLLDARATNVGIYVSPFTAWEIGMLVAKDRVQLALSPEAWFEALLAIPDIRLASLTPAILLASTVLPGTPPSDPADRIIVATARTLDLVVITRDRQMLDYGDQGHLRAITC
jgi:PIN domain nuclease of toxin-antitoxin system